MGEAARRRAVIGSMKPYIGITQDGAGLLRAHDEFGGLYTQNVASCIVYAVHGDQAVGLIHDTRQLAISSVRNLLAQCGTILKIYCAQNKSMRYQEQDDAYIGRRQRMLLDIFPDDSVEVLNIEDGHIAFCRNGTPIINDRALREIERDAIWSPDIARRHAINILNNLFSPFNAQSISVDVQFAEGSFTKHPILRYELDEMYARARHELNSNNDHDYMLFLESCRAIIG